MIEVKIYNNEEFEKSVRYFKKLCEKDGFLREVQDRRYYKKPSEKNREETRRRNKMFAKMKEGK